MHLIHQTVSSAASLVMVVATAVGVGTSLAFADAPVSVLKSVFPAGGQSGTVAEVTVAGDGFDKLTTLHVNHPSIQVSPGAEENQFRLTIPAVVEPGCYDLRAVGRNGISSPLAFQISNRLECLEIEPNGDADGPQPIDVNCVVNGRIQDQGDIDQYRFSAKRGQRVVVECWSERIDSPLRPVLQLLDDQGRILDAHRCGVGLDPSLVVDVTQDTDFVIKLSDLIHGGTAEHVYRLDIDTGPRILFSVPSVVEKEMTRRVTLFGWNLNTSVDQPLQYDTLETDVTAPSHPLATLPVRLEPAQVVLDGFVYRHPDGHAPIVIGMSDVPVVLDGPTNQTADTAQEIEVPCEISGQLIAEGETDWYAVDARRGEVFWLEGFGKRIGSPVDLDISVLDATGEKQLARFSDELDNIGGNSFPSNHLDPSGRWVAPTDGRYLVVIRDLIGTLRDDPRRGYRLSVRREEPDFQLAVVPTYSGGTAGINVARGGRTAVEVFAFRRRGRMGPIHVSGIHLPAGIECPTVTIGSDVNSAPLVFSVAPDAEPFVGVISVVGTAIIGADVREHVARGGVALPRGSPLGSGRVTAEIPMAITNQAPLRVTARHHTAKRHLLYGDLDVIASQGTLVDVAVHVERVDPTHTADVTLTGVGLPVWMRNQTATIPAGQDQGIISFYIPDTMPSGPHTIAVRANTTAPDPSDRVAADQEKKPVSVVSNAVTFDVTPASMTLAVSSGSARQIGRGEVVTVNYTVKRKNGFIGKIHTELDAPDEVKGIRGRGVTFVGQTESGTIQIVANDDAPLGQQPFLRLWAVGVVEDKPVHHASCLLDLEIVE